MRGHFNHSALPTSTVYQKAELLGCELTRIWFTTTIPFKIHWWLKKQYPFLSLLL